MRAGFCFLTPSRKYTNTMYLIHNSGLVGFVRTLPELLENLRKGEIGLPWCQDWSFSLWENTNYMQSSSLKVVWRPQCVNLVSIIRWGSLIAILMIQVMAFWTWMFTMSKIAELGDTAFIILRKQNLIFLHWWLVTRYQLYLSLVDTL